MSYFSSSSFLPFIFLSLAFNAFFSLTFSFSFALASAFLLSDFSFFFGDYAGEETTGLDLVPLGKKTSLSDYGLSLQELSSLLEILSESSDEELLLRFLLPIIQFLSGDLLLGFLSEFLLF